MVEFVVNKVRNVPENDIEKDFSLFSVNFLRRWKTSGRKSENFLKQYNYWLQHYICKPTMENSVQTVGRPLKNFSLASDTTKRIHVKALVASHSPKKLLFAAQSSLIKTGNRNAASVIKKAITSSPTTLKHFKKMSKSKTDHRPYSVEEALALITNAKLTTAQYKQIRKEAKKRKCNIYPSYNIILAAKKNCYPKNININETSAQVPLQNATVLIGYVLLRKMLSIT
ncbi:unnamed protein product [Psylliodes chrysocephalus]|uniref:Uncharacterized protein n=1 Tax=Psylliodes chrysocephalus TaxID=3402493 RepID=A0A9P0CY87_9CUCU|nr:unnamed protein product [Psylliodes chrysocephala]